GEEEKETSVSGRNESSVGTRRPREDDSDASGSKRSRSGSDRPLADAEPLSSPRGGDDDDSTPHTAVTSRTNPVRDPWMPSPSEIQSRCGNTSPVSPYALYSCSAIVDDDVTKELDFDPATEGAVRLSERDLIGYTGISVPKELKTLREKLVTQLSAEGAEGDRNPQSRAVGDYSSRSSFTPFGGAAGGGIRTPSPFPERRSSGRSAAPTYRGQESILTNEYEYENEPDLGSNPRTKSIVFELKSLFSPMFVFTTGPACVWLLFGVSTPGVGTEISSIGLRAVRARVDTADILLVSACSFGSVEPPLKEGATAPSTLGTRGCRMAFT
ncbi:hypothetical protein PR003_g30065, partial [Phytophthora rubi]